MAKKGDWVLLRGTVLLPGERAPQVPEDTARVPLLMWVKGHLREDALPGQQASVLTRTGRLAEGILEEEAPAYAHGFGGFVPELLAVQEGIKAALFGEETP